MSTTEIVMGLVILGAVAAVLATVLLTRKRERKNGDLRRRFGPEYERVVARHGNVESAERELAAREKRVHKLHIRELTEAERTHFTASWQNVQARFVDDPAGAVHVADELVDDVMRARGYPIEDFEQRVADLSVDHAYVVQHYRAARVLAEANRQTRGNTEELRQAMVHYRALFAELVETHGSHKLNLQEAHA